jgi:shikimate kinase
LIGPISVGKSTVAKAIASKLKIKCLHCDSIRWKYFNELNYNYREAKILGEQGWKKLFEYWRPFEVHAIERILSDYNNAIIDFGAGFSMFKDKTFLRRVHTALQNNYTFLLLPCKGNEKKSLEILKERFKSVNGVNSISQDTVEFLLFTLNYHSHKILSDHIIYTENKTPEEVASEIINVLKDLNVDLAQFTL